MKHLIQLWIIAAMTALLVFPTQAQTSQVIQYGQQVTFQLTNQSNKVSYQFKGSKGDVIVASVQPVEITGNYDYLDLSLSDFQKNVLADTSENLTDYLPTLAFELSADDTYTLTVKLQSGSSDTNIGGYYLFLNRPSELTANQPVTGKLDAVSHFIDYYLVRPTDQPLTLTYSKLEGDAIPEIDVNELRNSGVTPIITLGGLSLTQGQVLLPQHIDPMIISVGGFNLIDAPIQQTVSYKLSIS